VQYHVSRVGAAAASTTYRFPATHALKEKHPMSHKTQLVVPSIHMNSSDAAYDAAAHRADAARVAYEAAHASVRAAFKTFANRAKAYEQDLATFAASDKRSYARLATRAAARDAARDAE